MRKWFDEANCASSNVVYSRVRLARNISGYRFPKSLEKEEDQELVSRVMGELSGLTDGERGDFTVRELAQIRDLERKALRERRILNAAVVEKKGAAALLMTEDEGASVIVNGDDHIRIQVLGAGLCLENLWAEADGLDDRINEKLEYAFDEKYGYLTSFLTNVGTGLRACAVLHLPMLSQVKKFQNIVSDMSRVGTSIRGLYGEGAENYGSLYEISNQRTLGQSEEEIIELVTKAAKQLNNQEQRVRQAGLDSDSKRLDRLDEIWKSYGVLKYARKITERDARIFLSLLMAGEADELVSFASPCSLYRLILGSKPANLRLGAQRPLETEELDCARAAYIRERLPEING